MENKKNILSANSAFFLVILAGILARVWFFLLNREFWYDESSLALNIINRNFLELLAPLDFQQFAPWGFLFLSKLSTVFLGFSEFSLRFLPFLAGVLSLFLFLEFSKKFLRTNFAKITALLVFALNFRLIFYSQEFKQYSLDVLLTLASVLLFLKIDPKTLTPKKAFLWGLLFSSFVFFSHTFIIVFTSLCLVSAFRAFKKDFPLKNLVLFAAPTGVSFLVFYFFNATSTLRNEWLYTWWDFAFIAKDFSNFFEVLSKQFAYLFGFSVWGVFIALLVILGFYLIKRENFELFLLASLPVFVNILLSWLHIYPFGDRLTLYLLPFWIVIFSKVFDSLNIKTAPYKGFFICLFALWFCLSSVAIFPQRYFEDSAVVKEKMRSMREILNTQPKNDKVFYAPRLVLTLRYYDFLNPQKQEFIEFTGPPVLQKGEKCWFLTTTLDKENHQKIVETIKKDYVVIKMYNTQTDALFYVKKD